ncbi:MAG: Uma2 family endonuclease [Rubrivivax sp.]|nr:Uma2 family endonuclease [Pyrinomonadaceae bacterium]
MSVQIERRHFSVNEFDRMADAGILSEDDRVELIEGEIIEMSPIGSRHAACVRRLDALFNRRLGGAAQVSAQNPVLIDDYSQPEPDVALLKPRADYYSEEHPSARDVLLIVEVADTSVEYDRQVKAPLYARAGVVEMWLINLHAEVVEVYTQPDNGAYRDRKQFTRGDSISFSGIPGLTISVEEILG